MAPHEVEVEQVRRIEGRNWRVAKIQSGAVELHLLGDEPLGETRVSGPERTMVRSRFWVKRWMELVA